MHGSGSHQLLQAAYYCHRIASENLDLARHLSVAGHRPGVLELLAVHAVLLVAGLLVACGLALVDDEEAGGVEAVLVQAAVQQHQPQLLDLLQHGLHHLE